MPSRSEMIEVTVAVLKMGKSVARYLVTQMFMDGTNTTVTHSEAINRSTLSSCDTNGSLQSTVRWA